MRPAIQYTFYERQDTTVVVEEGRAVCTVYKKLLNKQTGEKGVGTTQ